MNIMLEGQDRCGKDTQIGLIKSHFKDRQFQTLHYSNIRGLTSNECVNYSAKLYDDMFKLCKYGLDNNVSFIFNRAHFGEYVYGKIYREYEGDYIFDIELNNFEVLNDIYLIVLVDEPENLLSREDGLSLGNKLEQKAFEKKRFEEAFNRSNVTSKILINISGLSIDEVNNIILDFIMKGEKC